MKLCAIRSRSEVTSSGLSDHSSCKSQSKIVKLNQNRNAGGVAVGELLVLVIVIRYHLSENANVSVYSELVTMGG